MAKKDEHDICPLCKSTRHSDIFEIRTGTDINDDYEGNLKGYPTYTDFVYCFDCGVVRAYDISIYSKTQVNHSKTKKNAITKVKKHGTKKA